MTYLLFIFHLLILCFSFEVVKRTEKRRKKLKAAAHNDTGHHQRNREVELATLRQLPTNNNFVTENNVLYNLSTFPGKLKEIKDCDLVASFLLHICIEYKGIISICPGVYI